MPDKIKLVHSVTGGRAEVPDEAGVFELYQSQGWELAPEEPPVRDPIFGTYEAEDAPPDDEPDDDFDLELDDKA